jgi:hypothetical protein
VVAALPAPALAAGHGPAVVNADILGSLGGLAGGIFSGIGHAVLGAFSWTIGLASKFILTTIAALVHLLIPHAWISKGLQIMRWIVAIPNYAGQITTPGGGHAYGFAGINALRDVFTWLGVAVAPLSLAYATTRALVGEGEPVGIPVLRTLLVAVAVLSYPYWWAQGAALANQVTNAILTVPAVAAGLQRLMAYAVGGVALGGWQLIDLGLMGATGLALLGLIFLKVVVILLGALLYATGPLMIGLIPTRGGGGLARAWVSAAVMLLGLGIAWAAVFAVGAVLIGDSATAGPLVAGGGTFGDLVGGLLLAIAGLASLWLCLKVAKEAAGVLRMQLGGLLMISGGGRSQTTAVPRSTVTRTSAASLRAYGSRLSGAIGAAGGELAMNGGAGGALVAARRAAGHLGRRGLVGTAATGVRILGATAAPAGGRLMERSRAGTVAARLARAGSAGWNASGRAAPAPQARKPAVAATKTAGRTRPARRRDASATPVPPNGAGDDRQTRRAVRVAATPAGAGERQRPESQADLRQSPPPTTSRDAAGSNTESPAAGTTPPSRAARPSYRPDAVISRPSPRSSGEPAGPGNGQS